jgi:predicted HTH transcriptional regulator
MNEETILNFIKKGESETVEFKSTLDQAAIETIKGSVV